MFLTEIVSSIDRAFPVFSSGERHIDETLNRFPFDQGGMKQRWDWYNRLSKNVFEFLKQEFPRLGQQNCSIICRFQMSRLREKITKIETGV